MVGKIEPSAKKKKIYVKILFFGLDIHFVPEESSKGFILVLEVPLLEGITGS